ncbi:MAG: hypothetical protein BRD23_07015, partial [Halobacteriales archaeon SW_9_67_25]
MPRTAQKIDDIAGEGKEMTEALSVALDVAEEQGTVTWSDISDDITSGQWGRLIEKGLLVDAGGDGFVVDDPNGVREALGEADPDTSSDDGNDDTSWTKYDKIAGVGVLGLFLGYSMPSIRSRIGGVIDLFMGPIEAVLPFYIVIMVLAMLTGMYTTILQDALMDSSVMGDYQDKNKELKERRKRAKERDDEEELERIREEQMEMMSENVGMFKAQFRPMVWIMLLTIPVFLWLSASKRLRVLAHPPMPVWTFSAFRRIWLNPIEHRKYQISQIWTGPRTAVRQDATSPKMGNTITGSLAVIPTSSTIQYSHRNTGMVSS